MNIILSIKPKYSKQILDLTKLYELRKAIPKKNIKYIYIYESYPTKRIVARFPFSNIIEMEKELFWNNYSNKIGISKQDFDLYYEKKNNVFAYEIKNLEYLNINPYEIIENFTAPQNYMYLKNEL